MEYLTNEMLIEAYKLALRLDLDQEFISLLEKEIARRGINIENINKE